LEHHQLDDPELRLYSRPPHFVQHALAEDLVDAGLVSFAGLFEPRDHVGIEANGDGLFHRSIETSALDGMSFLSPLRSLLKTFLEYPQLYVLG
jgi:hypothetical protein